MKDKKQGNKSGLTIDRRFMRDSEIANFQSKTLSESQVKALESVVTVRAFCSPELAPAVVIQDVQDSTSLDAVVDELRQQTALVQDGNLEHPKAMLMAQANALNALFFSLTKRSLANARDGHYLDAADRYMRLALKAQAQATRTLEVLSEIVNPRPVAYVRQANIAQTQQVNNSPARENTNSANQTIREGVNGLHQNPRTQSLAGKPYPPMETMEEINRTKVFGCEHVN